MTKKTSPRGLAPSAKEITAKKADGYLTPKAVAQKYNMSLATVHRWAKHWRPTAELGGSAYGRMFDGKIGAFKLGTHVWILEAAVKATIGGRDERAA